MKRGMVVFAALCVACAPLAGCAGKSVINAYLFDDANVGGAPDKSLKPIKSVLVWPLENIAAGTKVKKGSTVTITVDATQ